MPREFYLERREAEFPVFVRVLKAIPQGKLHYKPHDRSPSAEQLVWTLVSQLRVCINVVVEEKGDWKLSPAPPFEQMIELFERWWTELSDRVAQMEPLFWYKPAQFFRNGKLVSEQPIGAFLWLGLFDAIHHRGQLAAYLRPMGAKVPSIYGPSADEQQPAE